MKMLHVAMTTLKKQNNIMLRYVIEKKILDYFVKVDGKKLKVCKKAFAALHGVGKKRVERLCTLLSMNKSPHDMRGKTTSNVKSEVLTSAIQEHIQKLWWS